MAIAGRARSRSVPWATRSVRGGLNDLDRPDVEVDVHVHFKLGLGESGEVLLQLRDASLDGEVVVTQPVLRRGIVASGPAGVRAMPHGGDIDDAAHVVEEVQDAIRATASGPRGRHGWVKRLSHAVRVVQQWPGDELVGCGCHLLGQRLGEGSGGGPGDAQPVTFAHRGRRPALRMACLSWSASR